MSADAFKRLHDYTGMIDTNTAGIGVNTTSIGVNATNIGTNTTAIGSNTTNIGANSTAIVANTTNIGTNTAALGTNTTNIGANTAAIGGNTTNIGANRSSITALETDLGTLQSSFGNLQETAQANTEGVAMAMAISGGILPDDKSFAISGNLGFFEGESALAVSGSARVSDNLQINAGLGIGLGQNTTGGRVGFTLAW